MKNNIKKLEYVDLKSIKLELESLISNTQKDLEYYKLKYKHISELEINYSRIIESESKLNFHIEELKNIGGEDDIFNIRNGRKYKYDPEEHKKRFKENPISKIKNTVKARIRYYLYKESIQGYNIDGLVGCDYEHLMEHLESNFKDGMNWDNHGRNGWHIDHIKPIYSFNLKDDDQIRECFNYKNLQPLWECENLGKGCKILD